MPADGVVGVSRFGWIHWLRADKELTGSSLVEECRARAALSDGETAYMMELDKRAMKEARARRRAQKAADEAERERVRSRLPWLEEG